MKISDKMVASINDQIKAEFDSAYIYLAMSTYLEEENFHGMAHWMNKQHEEELEHAHKFIHYLQERGAHVVVPVIDKPKDSYNGPLDVFKTALKHEEYVTERIYKMMHLAQEEKDYASISLLRWYVDEQVEEESDASDIVQKLEFVGDGHASLYLLDKELGKRD